MDERMFFNLIEKYKRGECSSREKELLENYLEAFQNNHRQWNENEMGNQKQIDEKIYFEILKNIGKEKIHYFPEVFYSSYLLKWAASIAFIFILATSILYVSGVFEMKTNSVAWLEKITQPGEKKTITLNDGSIVTLNAGSKLKYPAKFSDDGRVIYLEGEAYFDVHHNINQPFIVHTENLSTTVLGTRFNISAYPENKDIAISLLEGKVEVTKSNDKKTKEINVLKPSDRLVYNKEMNKTSLGYFDPLDAIGWIDSIYKFENKTLGFVFAELERAFGVKFKLLDRSVLSQKITIKFEKNSIKTVADVIKSLTGLDYKIIKKDNDIKEIVFYRKTK